LGVSFTRGRRIFFYILFFSVWFLPVLAVVHFADITGISYIRNVATPYYGQIEDKIAASVGAPIGTGPGIHPTNPPSFSLEPAKGKLIQAVNTWPPDVNRLLQQQLVYLLLALCCNFAGMLAFRRFLKDRAP
jgi:hypothetical protein